MGLRIEDLLRPTAEDGASISAPHPTSTSTGEDSTSAHRYASAPADEAPSSSVPASRGEVPSVPQLFVEELSPYPIPLIGETPPAPASFIERAPPVPAPSIAYGSLISIPFLEDTPLTPTFFIEETFPVFAPLIDEASAPTYISAPDTQAPTPIRPSGDFSIDENAVPMAIRAWTEGVELQEFAAFDDPGTYRAELEAGWPYVHDVEFSRDHPIIEALISAAAAAIIDLGGGDGRGDNDDEYESYHPLLEYSGDRRYDGDTDDGDAAAVAATATAAVAGAAAAIAPPFIISLAGDRWSLPCACPPDNNDDDDDDENYDYDGSDGDHRSPPPAPSCGNTFCVLERAGLRGLAVNDPRGLSAAMAGRDRHRALLAAGAAAGRMLARGLLAAADFEQYAHWVEYQAGSRGVWHDLTVGNYAAHMAALEAEEVEGAVAVARELQRRRRRRQRQRQQRQQRQGQQQRHDRQRDADAAAAAAALLLGEYY